MMVEAYYATVNRTLSTVMATQAGAIEEAGRLGAEAILNGGLIHAFGTGHSHMIAEELFDRAGGLVLVNAILEPSLMLHEGVQRSSSLERLPGYAQRLLELEPLTAGDLLIVISNSGRNAAPVEAAMYARERGLKVAAITSVAHSKSQPPNHASGKKLYELADVVIDNCGIPGDAALEVPGSPALVCATSTVAGAFIAQ
ncbi:MAG TPA: SIS domain-containing protein, partial [Symbiobacteriaceae bacterium]|nr:SIS domain-containing protein [Symbiobacteriaceae bacterium]